MTRRQRHIEPSVSLFPFLTVLICTIGMLIVLLVISVRAVGKKSQAQSARAEESHTTAIKVLQADLDLQSLRQEGWQEIRDRTASKVRMAREERSHLEQAIVELESEAALVAAQLQQLFDRPDSSADMPALQQSLDDLRRQIAEQKQIQSSSPPDLAPPTLYNLVPYRGPNGTHRRPIYVECVEQKLILQPLAIELRLDDIPVPGEPGNPLDAALTSIREYWKRLDSAGQSGDPYPLLVVRPNGSQAYALARRAMTSWVDEFGYELIDSHKAIHFGDADPQLAEEVRRAVDRSRKRQQELANEYVLRERVLQQRAIARQMASGAGGLRADRVRGGFVSDSSVPGSLSGPSPKALPPSVAEGARNSAQDPAEVKRVNGSVAAESETGQVIAKEKKLPNESSEASSTTFNRPGGQAGGSAPFQSSSPPELTALAKSRGTDWALPGKSAQRSTAYLRPIRLVCDAQQVTVDSGARPLQSPQVIPFQDRTESSVEPLIAAIWQQIDSWGQTPDNGYWKPQLKLRVLPGGESRLRDLQVLLEDSGIEIFQEIDP